MSGWRTFYTVARSFRFGGRSFSKGEILRADDPIVDALSDRHDLLFMTVTCRELVPDSRRPQEMAGVRSVQERRPARDWLAETPTWRLP